MRGVRVVPREVQSSLRMAKHERPLAAAPDSEGRYVVASDRALYLPTAAGSFDRIGWEQIEHAEWDREAEQLRVTPTAPFGAPIEHRAIAMPAPADRLLAVIRERITASVVIDRHVPLRGASGVRVVARRSPVGSGEPPAPWEPVPSAGFEDLQWALVFDHGVDPADPAVLDAARTALAEVQGEVSP